MYFDSSHPNRETNPTLRPLRFHSELDLWLVRAIRFRRFGTTLERVIRVESVPTTSCPDFSNYSRVCLRNWRSFEHGDELCPTMSSLSRGHLHVGREWRKSLRTVCERILPKPCETRVLHQMSGWNVHSWSRVQGSGWMCSRLRVWNLLSDRTCALFGMPASLVHRNSTSRRVQRVYFLSPEYVHVPASGFNTGELSGQVSTRNVLTDRIISLRAVSAWLLSGKLLNMSIYCQKIFTDAFFVCL